MVRPVYTDACSRFALEERYNPRATGVSEEPRSEGLSQTRRVNYAERARWRLFERHQVRVERFGGQTVQEQAIARSQRRGG